MDTQLTALSHRFELRLLRPERSVLPLDEERMTGMVGCSHGAEEYTPPHPFPLRGIFTQLATASFSKRRPGDLNFVITLWSSHRTRILSARCTDLHRGGSRIRTDISWVMSPVLYR